MVRGGLGLGGVIALGLLLVASCGSKEQCRGSERCACYANDTCNAGLECRSNLCVGSNANGQGGSASFDSAACLACTEKTCKAEYEACNGAGSCLDVAECALGCGSNVSCLSACSKNIDAATAQKLATYQSCALTQCLQDCVPVPVGSGGSAQGGSAGAGGAGSGLAACVACGEKSCKSEHGACQATAGCLDLLDCLVDCGQSSSCASACGGNVTAAAVEKLVAYQDCTVLRCAKDCSNLGSGGSGGGNSHGGSSGGGRSSGTGGTAGTGPLPPSITWLELEGAAAPSISTVNGPLGIEGVFYAYGDACATAQMEWDPDLRCLSGELCLADQTGTNWGVAIGFDLNNVAEVKHAWDANSVQVDGFAWRITGTPSLPLQFWVQNMDPAFNGTCSAASCSINGPPDGTRSAAASGQLAFSSMVKDDWGGTGTSYTFDARNISSLQFKVPAAINPLSTSFAICIESLGVMH